MNISEKPIYYSSILLLPLLIYIFKITDISLMTTTWVILFILYLGLFGKTLFLWQKLLLTITNLMMIAYLTSYFFQNQGFNAAFIYHLRPDVFTGGVTEYKTLFVLVILGVISNLHIFQKRFLGSDFRFYVQKRVLVVLILISPAHWSVAQTIFEALPQDESNYQTVFDQLNSSDTNIPISSDRKDIEVVYLESLERAFFDRSIFPDLLPFLTELKAESITFENIHQAPYTGWTIAGLFSSHCGLPFHTGFNFNGNEIGNSMEVAPYANCLTDILRDQGYSASFYGGANKSFAGKSKFLLSHGYQKVFGRSDLSSMLETETPMSPWGLFDQHLLELSDSIHNLDLESPYMSYSQIWCTKKSSNVL